MKFRKKPIVVEVFHFHGKTGENWYEARGFIEGNYDNTLNYPNIKTLEGIMEVTPGDYIIKGVQGEFYPCKPDIFEQTYEKVED